MRSKRLNIINLDWILILASAGIMIIGAIYLASASPSKFEVQLRWIGLGILTLVITLIIGYETLLRYAYLIYLAVLGSLVLVLFMPAHRGAQSWIDLPGFSIQPSELAKVAIVLILARHLKFKESQVTLRGLLPPVMLAFIPMVLILKQPDFGTAIMIIPLLAAVLFASGARTRHLLGAAVAGIISAVPVWFFVLKEYQKKRVFAFFDPISYQSDEGYQAVMARIGIGRGGLTGSGWGLGDINSLGLLPDRYSDFIFVVIAEEGGLLRAGLLLLLFAIVACCGLGAAAGTREPSGRLVAVGATTLIAFQAIINLSVAETLLPTTGVPLPLVSYGGSSMIASCILLGLILSVGISRPTILHGETFTGAE